MPQKCLQVVEARGGQTGWHLRDLAQVARERLPRRVRSQRLRPGARKLRGQILGLGGGRRAEVGENARHRPRRIGGDIDALDGPQQHVGLGGAVGSGANRELRCERRIR